MPPFVRQYSCTLLQGFSKQRVISHGAGQVTEYSCTEALGAMAS